MKRLCNKLIKILLSLTLSAFSFLSCEIGLGKAIDLQAPELSLDSHIDNDYVASKFKLFGTASDNIALTQITIDFDEADMHYRLLPTGVWEKKTSKTEGWEELSSDVASCTIVGKKWRWFIEIDTADSKPGTGSTYSFTIVSYDQMQNFDNKSKLDCSLVVDEKIPNVSIIKPELRNFYDDIKDEQDSLQLKDGNILSRLINGEVFLNGRQDSAASFKELRIEFDDGKIDSPSVTSQTPVELESLSCEAISNAYEFDRSKLYFAKTLKVGEDGILDLRTWDFSVKPEEWISDELNSELKTGKHIIRVVSTSISNSDSWQRQVLGYFTWWQEADEPWIIIYSGFDKVDNVAETPIYPSSSIFGIVQDDDGIDSLTYSLYKRAEDLSFNPIIENASLALSDENAKSSQWAINTPSESGTYKVVVTAHDMVGNTISAEKYFLTLDVQPPRINLENPIKDEAILSAKYSNHKIKFKGTVTDDGTINYFKIAYLNPKDATPDNKIKFIDPAAEDWKLANGQKDSNGNIVFTIKLDAPVFDSEQKINVYSFEQEFDLFDDLQIGKNKNTLNTQDFVLMAIDAGGTPKVDLVTLIGDSETPKLTVNTITLKDKNGTTIHADEFDDQIPNLPLIYDDYYVNLTGTWSDNSTTLWKDSSKINDLVITWGEDQSGNSIAELESFNIKNDGTWTAKLVNLPKSNDIITISLKDFANNETTLTKPVFIEKSSIELERITSEQEKGVYNGGDTISIVLEFTKNANFDSTKFSPKLKLNNGAEAVYKEGRGTSKFVFDYVVKNTDSDVDVLDVEEIYPSNFEYFDVTTNQNYTISLPTDALKKLSAKKLEIDNIAPKIKSITSITSQGNYKKDSSLIFMLEFTEDVNITNVENLKLVFNHKNGGNNVTTSSSSATGSKYVLLTYLVDEGDNASPLQLNSISHTDVQVTDIAGNSVVDWTYAATNFTGRIIDTNSPSKPVLNLNWSGDLVFDKNGTSFTISGESGASIEYSLNGGSSWLPYKNNEISLVNNQTYNILSKQTDLAGNISPITDMVSVTVYKGELFTKISSDMINGTYKTGDTISGYLQFERPVTIAKGATVTLNIENSGNYREVPLVECSSADATVSKYTFNYELVAGDSIDGNDVLNLIDFSFDSIKYEGKTVSFTYESIEADKLLSSSKEIRILTGQPKVQSLNISDEDEETVLTVTYDRNISKGNGSIVLTQSATDYKVPAVLTVTEYNDLKAVIGSDLDTYYKVGLNGATRNGNNLIPDTSKKYILDFAYDNNNTTLVNLFRTNNIHIVEIPIYVSAVTVNNNILTVKLSGAYSLPVKGASYSVEISEDAVRDVVRNSSAEYNGTLESPGIEKPEIRIKKENYTITNAGDTLKSNVTLPETAQMKISCKTPGASIKYGKNELKSTTVVVNTINKYTTKTTDVTAPNVNTNYTGSINVGDSTLNFDNSRGLKIAISAQATKNSISSEISYEYAARTVLKFYIGNKYKNRDETNVGEVDDNGNFKTEITDKNENKVHVSRTTVWIIGGDDESGGNTIEPFPLSWGDPANFKMMRIDESKDKNSVEGKWYWLTWDLSAPAYHGFVVGDVPSDAQTKGPSIWYAGECYYTPLKSHYVLYPGETLLMTMHSSYTNPDTNKAEAYDEGDRASYFFRKKNKGTR